MPLRSEMTMGEFVKLKNNLDRAIESLLSEFTRTTGAYVNGCFVQQHRVDTLGSKEVNDRTPYEARTEVELPI